MDVWFQNVAVLNTSCSWYLLNSVVLNWSVKNCALFLFFLTSKYCFSFWARSETASHGLLSRDGSSLWIRLQLGLSFVAAKQYTITVNIAMTFTSSWLHLISVRSWCRDRCYTTFCARGQLDFISCWVLYLKSKASRALSKESRVSVFILFYL